MSSTVVRRRLYRVVAATAVLAWLAACSDSSSSSSSSSTTTTAATSTTAPAPKPAVVFNGQGNNLDAYGTQPDGAGAFPTQRVITTQAKDPAGRDINGQICFDPSGSGRFIAGEDTYQPNPLQGWGIFELSGDGVGSFSAKQIGKLTPTYQDEKDNAENYGCGWLSDGRVVTTDVGDQALGPANGQLVIWFPPLTGGPQGDPKSANSGFAPVKFCKLDVAIGTAQSLLVAGDNLLYVASARGGGVLRYRGPFPTGPDAAGGCDGKDAKGSPLATKVTRDVFIPAGQNDLATAAGLAPAPEGGLYVSSVFNGVINEYGPDGAFRRNVLRPPAGEQLGAKPFSTGTPLGIGTDAQGNLYYADIGIVVAPGKLPGPGRGTGTVRRIRFTGGQPQAPETMATGLAFPDGIGIWQPGATKGPAKP